MSIEAEVTRVVELFQLPFMQRALMGGVLTGLMGGLSAALPSCGSSPFSAKRWGSRPCWALALGCC